MKIAFGHMHYTPEVFWSFTLREWQACVQGYHDKLSAGRSDDYVEPLTSDELRELEELVDGNRLNV